MESSLDSDPLVLYAFEKDTTESDCACASVFSPSILYTFGPLFESDCACPGDEFCLAEQDCACPDDGFAPATARAPRETIIWQAAPALYRAPLPNDHEVAFNPLGAVGVTVLNAPARRILDAFAQPRTLPQAIAALDAMTPANVLRASHDLAALGMLQPVGVASTFTRAQPRTLIAWLHITNACNLRCAYCYINKTNEAMDESTGIAAVEAVFRSALTHQFRAVKLKYAGGEPSLNFDLVMKLHAHARRLADASGLELREVLLSNGVTLTDTMLDAIRDAHIRLMISLDGIGIANDAQRARADGRGSYACIARTIDHAQARGITPHLSITVTTRNVDHLAETVAFALERALPFNLNFVRADGDPSADCARWIGGLRAAFAVIEKNLPPYSLLGTLDRARFDQPHEYPCGVGHNYIVIDHHGRVARCQMQITHAVGDVSYDDPLTIIRSAPDDFENLAVDQREGCDVCTWKYWCAGGCPLMTFRTMGRSNARSPYCEIYQTLYPELLRLEGLRILYRQYN